MLQTPAPLRIALDAHVVGRRQTGNEMYVVNLGSALAQRTDVVPLAYVDRGVRWPEGLASPRLRELRFRARQLRIPIELPYRARVDGADIVHVQYVAPLTRGFPTSLWPPFRGVDPELLGDVAAAEGVPERVRRWGPILDEYLTSVAASPGADGSGPLAVAPPSDARPAPAA